VPLSKWLEQVIRLPSGIASVPGPIKLHPYQRGIADEVIELATQFAASAHSRFWHFSDMSRCPT
jgi:hypothetical protein